MIRGRCLCGDVEYEIEGSISPIWLCHCSKCRRANGSAFHASAICRAQNFRFCRGVDGIREYEDTPGYVTRFCGRCGSPVPQQLRGSEIVFLHAGALDGDPGRRVDHHIFTASKAPWFEITDEHPRFEEHKPRSE
ncbi:MAG: GFA family protein [bacterium]|nr:GFA family protein [bacterium]